MAEPVYLSASADAVDAALVTKAHAVHAFASTSKVPVSKIGAIGDSVNDLPFLTIPDLGLIGAPLNAQPSVRSTITLLKNSIQLSSSFLDAFLEFYTEAEQRKILYIFTDKDGVLSWKDHKPEYISALNAVFCTAGLGTHPFVFILTGSSSEQNIHFVRSVGLYTTFAHNPKVREHPFLLLAENGTVQINVLTGEIWENRKLIDPSLLGWLKGPFERQLIAIVEKEILPRFHLSWSASANDQVESVWIPKKRTMVTVNIPKTFRDGHDYRMSMQGKEFGLAVLDCMVRLTQASGVPYTIL
jgi:hypothetical protein